MGHVAVFRDDLESLDCLGVAYYVVEEEGAVFFDPTYNVPVSRVTWQLSSLAVADGDVPW